MSSYSHASSSSNPPPTNANLAIIAPNQNTNIDGRLQLAPGRYRFSESGINIVIGISKISFLVHKDLLCRNSGFFAAILATNTKPAGEIQITLEHVKPTVFEGFLSWLYTRDAIFPPMTLRGPETRLKHLPWPLALDLYALGRYLDCPAFGNTVIYSMRSQLDARMPLPMPNAEEVTAIYQQTGRDCGLRNLVVLMHTTMARSGGLFITDEEARLWTLGVPAEFLGDMVVKMTQQRAEWADDFWRQARVLEWIIDQ
jgi:BTB/POZ domain